MRRKHWLVNLLFGVGIGLAISAIAIVNIEGFSPVLTFLVLILILDAGIFLGLFLEHRYQTFEAKK